MRTLITTLLFAYTTCLLGQEDVSLSINTSADTVLMHNVFKLEFLAKNSAMDDFEAPDLSAFDLIQGPSRSMSTSYINGVKSSTESYTYYYRPLKTGKFKIKAFEITTDGKSYKSNDQTIIVIDNPDNLFQDPNTGQIEGMVKKPKPPSKRKRFRI